MGIRSLQKILFLHPQGELPSGGNLFNRRIVGLARQHRFPLSSWVVECREASQERSPVWLPAASSRGAQDSKPLLLWDSLLMPRLAAAPAGGWHALLMHYLPSLDPGLAAAARTQARRIEDCAAERARFFLASGRGLAAVLRERYPEIPSFLCEPGVDAVFSRVCRGRSPHSQSGVVNLLTVANLMPAKGYRELLAIVDQLSDRRWCWHIVGSADVDPEFRREFLLRAAPSLSQGRIVLHGVLSPRRLARLMAWMDAFVSASHYESYGIALAEAVAAGLPVLATEVGEARRIACGGEARIVPVGVWSAFASALQQMLEDLSARPARISREGRPPVRSWANAFADFCAACRVGYRCLD